MKETLTSECIDELDPNLWFVLEMDFDDEITDVIGEYRTEKEALAVCNRLQYNTGGIGPNYIVSQGVKE